jgi:hypothetical protein
MMPNWMSTLFELAGFAMLSVGLAAVSIPLALVVCGSLLIIAGVMAA